MSRFTLFGASKDGLHGKIASFSSDSEGINPLRPVNLDALEGRDCPFTLLFSVNGWLDAGAVKVDEQVTSLFSVNGCPFTLLFSVNGPPALRLIRTVTCG